MADDGAPGPFVDACGNPIGDGDSVIIILDDDPNHERPILGTVTAIDGDTATFTPAPYALGVPKVGRG